MNPELRDLSYEHRLIECGLPTLETMRLRGGQTVFKILNENENIDRHSFSHSRLKKDLGLCLECQSCKKMSC